MKRYKAINFEYDDAYGTGTALDIIEHNEGEFVKYDDIKHLLKTTSSNSEYVKLPKLSSLVKELEKTGLLNPEYKDHFIEESRYNCVEVVLDVIKRMAKE